VVLLADAWAFLILFVAAQEFSDRSAKSFIEEFNRPTVMSFSVGSPALTRATMQNLILEVCDTIRDLVRLRSGAGGARP
jgi:hypothetical protein